MKYKMYLCWEPLDNLKMLFGSEGIFCRPLPIDVNKFLQFSEIFWESVVVFLSIRTEEGVSVSFIALFRIYNIMNPLPYSLGIYFVFVKKYLVW